MVKEFNPFSWRYSPLCHILWSWDTILHKKTIRTGDKPGWFHKRVCDYVDKQLWKDASMGPLKVIYRKDSSYRTGKEHT